jgi:hypothetical protein
MVQCEYLGVKFQVSRKVIKSLQALELSTELDYAEQQTAGGLPQLAIKGFKPQNTTLEYTCMQEVGLDPFAEYNSWKKKIGKAGELYVGDSQFGVDKFVLRGVSLSGTKIDNRGRFRLGTITLDLSQDIVAKGGSNGS